MGAVSSREKKLYPAVCLMGPTASGKTDLAVELAQRLPFEIINVDSAQIYKGMDIGTGKPDAETLCLAPHRLLDFLDPALSYSASQFCQDARREMKAIHEKGKIPLLVGGTMLYFKALRDGLADMPAADPLVRQEIEQLAANSGWAAVHAQLAEVDPVSAARIHPNDPQRLQRALEVYRLSGKTLTELHGTAADEDVVDRDFPFHLHFLAIQPGLRSVLHDRIERRFMSMLAAGLVAEVEQLYQRGDLSLDMPSMRCVGYRQVWQYLSGELRYDDMVEKSIIATRQLAKRQVTWLRGWDNLQGFESENPDLLSEVLKLLESNSI